MAQPGRDRVGTTGLGSRRQHSRCAHDKAWEHGDSSLGVRTTRPGRVHDKNTRVTEEFYCDRLGL